MYIFGGDKKYWNTRLCEHVKDRISALNHTQALPGNFVDDANIDVTTDNNVFFDTE